MPSNKTIVIFIISASIVACIWLFTKEKNTEGDNQVVAGNPRAVVETENDWQKILTDVDSSQNEISSVVRPVDEEIVNDTSLTAKISQDFLSQYFLSIRDDGTITDAEISQITKNIVSMPEYTQIKGAVYLQANLNIVNKNNRDFVTSYKNTVNRLLRESSTQVKENPVDIAMTAIETENESVLLKLDPTIRITKGFIEDMLAIEVPSSATSHHLKLLNAISNILASLEAMRDSVSDPIAGIAGINHYQNTTSEDLNFALLDINSYFAQRTGSAI
ncbi:MAG: hypothetical protein V4690_02895 [Patescibacteria group bacterium]